MLLLTLPYCQKDSALLKKCLAWMAELQPRYDFPCLLVADLLTPESERLALAAQAKAMFTFTETMHVEVPANSQGWPNGCNYMFAAAARQISECYKLPWLWFEPDMTPLKAFWLDSIAEAYHRHPKRFMGSLIPSQGQPDMPPIHLAGCAVYPANAYQGLQSYLGGNIGWDIASAGYSVPRATNLPAMQHFWGKHDLAPTFTNAITGPENALSLDVIQPNSLTFHRCKDGSLIDLLRQKANSRPVSTADSVIRPEPVEASGAQSAIRNPQSAIESPAKPPAPARARPRDVKT